jgi:hypothetical protein
MRTPEMNENWENGCEKVNFQVLIQKAFESDLLNFDFGFFQLRFSMPF